MAWLSRPQCLLTVRMITVETVRLLDCFPKDETDGMFGMILEFAITDEMLSECLDGFVINHLHPALYSAWDGRETPWTDQPLALPARCDAAVEQYRDFEVRVVRMYQMGTAQEVLRIEARRGAWN